MWLLPETNPYRELIADRVNAFGGTAIIATWVRLKIGATYDPIWTSGSFPGSDFDQPGIVLREASRAEYLAFPWPDGHDVLGVYPYYFEIGFD